MRLRDRAGLSTYAARRPRPRVAEQTSMTKKMLIDAAHPEEVRVAVIDQGKVEDFDFESASRKPLRGNIYLARVTRVEPSLQAAFVEYGGNRHGFLAFNEIHPDYYQIPVSDRQILQEAEAEEAALAAELELMQRGDETNDDGDFQMGASDDDVDEDGEDADEIEASADADDDENDSDDSGDGHIDGDSIDEDDDDAAEMSHATDAEEAVEDEEQRMNADAARDADATDDEEEEEEDVDEEDNAKEAADRREGEDDDDTQASEASEDDKDDGQLDEVESEDLAAANDEPAPDESEPETASAEGSVDDEDDASETDESADEEVEAADAEADDADDYDVGASEDQDEGADATDDAEKSAAREAAKARAALYERYKEAKRKRARLVRNYKIQEVSKRRQILLIQVVKEERGTKGAALTTYLSLAGRYCVLMPNTARGGGISRKIPSAADRRRLRRVVDSLDVPQGMGLIIRTAGAKRTKIEIKRDYDYLVRLWENIRTLTLKSIAPCLVYEEASLIKRAIRDLYDKDISKVFVEGEAGYREAKDFMKMLMPSHAKNVQPYKDKAPILLKHGVESQLDQMYQPSVRLKSGGYIVIHQTEALVAIDVNSGRSTRERNIEQTALKTNIEAAKEAARQFRLRDLAGLVVIDFIDMEEQKHNRMVEKRFKEAIKADRARIQVGRISNFGLLELSRQRRRSGIVDGTTHTCPTCAGAGVVRSHEMAALRILRAIEGEAISGKVGRIVAKTSLDVSLHILNQNRAWVNRIENDYGVSIEITADPEKAGDQYDIEKSGAPKERKQERTHVSADQTEDIIAENEDAIAVSDSEEEASEDREGGKKKRRRRRKKRASAKSDEAQSATDADGEEEAPAKEGADAETQAGDGDEDDQPKRRRRRGRRGGRRNRRKNEDGVQADATPEAEQPYIDDAALDEQLAINGDAQAEATHQGANGEAGDLATEAEHAKTAETEEMNGGATETDAAIVSEEAAPTGNGADQSEPVEVAKDDAQSEPEEEPAPAPKKKPARKGWWQRAVGG